MREVTIPAEPCCGNCAAWQQVNGLQGECHLTPPQAVFMGFQPPKLAGQPPQPILAGVFPAVNAPALCRQWQPNKADEVNVPVTGPLADEPVLGPAFPKKQHTPVRANVGEEWRCQFCSAVGDELDKTECRHG
jgi:hypothetical protein